MKTEWRQKIKYFQKSVDSEKNVCYIPIIPIRLIGITKTGGQHHEKKILISNGKQNVLL